MFSSNYPYIVSLSLEVTTQAKGKDPFLCERQSASILAGQSDGRFPQKSHHVSVFAVRQNKSNK